MNVPCGRENVHMYMYTKESLAHFWCLIFIYDVVLSIQWLATLLWFVRNELLSIL